MGARKVMFVRWCFRPQDVADCGSLLSRQPYTQELFLTDIVEENDLATIVGRCYVVSPRKYAQLPPHLYDSNVFCCSLFLDTARERFQPLASAHLGPLYAEPPLRAPRINMPLVPLSGAVLPGFNRAFKKKSGFGSQCSSGERGSQQWSAACARLLRRGLRRAVLEQDSSRVAAV